MSVLSWDSYRRNFLPKRRVCTRFVDLEKDFDCIPSDFVWWASWKQVVEEWLVSYVISFSGEYVVELGFMLIIWHELVLREFKKQINSLKRTIWVKRDENKLKKTTKVMISCLKARNIRKEGEFPFVLCIKKVDSNSILCKFCKC